MQVVLIPCYRRPEMLAVTLEHIVVAEGSERHQYVFAVDHNFDLEIDGIIKNFPFKKTTTYYGGKKIGEGNAQNVLHGFKKCVEYALNIGASVIYYIEDDIWVAPDFFQFHELAHRKFSPAAVSACRNQYLERKIYGEANHVYYHPRYQSLGCSFSVETAAKIARHNTPLYYEDPERYLLAAFPSSKVLNIFWDSDGLIERVLEAQGQKTLYPCAPRAFHAGYYGGINRSGATLQGSLKERISKLRDMTEREMNENTNWQDIEFCNPWGYYVNDLEIIGY
jgi:hypothetical protein